MSESETPAAPLSPQEASAATPAAELERQIMYSGEPKNEREWWAAREIERLRARNEALTAERDEERGIVDRIWDLFGRPSYAELNGRSIYDLITALQARAESLERRNHDLAQDLEKADAVIAENESSLGWSRYAPTEWIEDAVARQKARAALDQSASEAYQEQ